MRKTYYSWSAAHFLRETMLICVRPLVRTRVLVCRRHGSSGAQRASRRLIRDMRLAGIVLITQGITRR